MRDCDSIVPERELGRRKETSCTAQRAEHITVHYISRTLDCEVLCLVRRKCVRRKFVPIRKCTHTAHVKRHSLLTDETCVTENAVVSQRLRTDFHNARRMRSRKLHAVTHRLLRETSPLFIKQTQVSLGVRGRSERETRSTRRPFIQHDRDRK